MLQLGERVVIVGDAFEQNLPVGEYGYVIAYDRNPDNAFDYVVRAPKTGRNYYVPADDIESEALLLEYEAERATQEALIDYALATYNEKLFRQVLNGEDSDADEQKEPTKEVMSQAEFIKQVNLRAWI
ncbi:ATPase [Paenibacillus sp. DYY-L-2]|uniref:ATPase n=1 Tax=Paenibacillus sp. DYY-L-2 TaxID=3447013 RepID=UPI003F50640D